MILLKTAYSYSRVEKEDPDELRHRKAQFLICKVLEKADSGKGRSSWKRRICKPRTKVGLRLRRLRFIVCRTKLCVSQKVVKQFRHLKHVLCNKEALF